MADQIIIIYKIGVLVQPWRCLSTKIIQSVLLLAKEYMQRLATTLISLMCFGNIAGAQVSEFLVSLNVIAIHTTPASPRWVMGIMNHTINYSR